MDMQAADWVDVHVIGKHMPTNLAARFRDRETSRQGGNVLSSWVFTTPAGR